MKKIVNGVIPLYKQTKGNYSVTPIKIAFSGVPFKAV
jgi:hypothetical protein